MANLYRYNLTNMPKLKITNYNLCNYIRNIDPFGVYLEYYQIFKNWTFIIEVITLIMNYNIIHNMYLPKEVKRVLQSCKSKRITVEFLKSEYYKQGLWKYFSNKVMHLL